MFILEDESLVFSTRFILQIHFFLLIPKQFPIPSTLIIRCLHPFIHLLKTTKNLLGILNIRFRFLSILDLNRNIPLSYFLMCFR